jgi:hypothetical protein
MPKTVTMRIDDDTYQMFRKAAHGARRTISNFLEFATISYLSQETYISDSEMREISKDKDLLRDLKHGEKEIKEGRYKIVG